MFTIKNNSEKSVGLMSGNDLQNKYNQISSKSTLFYFIFSATRPANPSWDLQTDSFLVSHG